jgi:hypothetical protein
MLPTSRCVILVPVAGAIDLGTLEASWKEHLGLLGKQVVAECHDGTYHGRLVGLSFRCIELAGPGEASLVLAPERIQHLFEAAEPERTSPYS